MLIELVLTLAQQPARSYPDGLTKEQHDRRIEILYELDEPNLPAWAGRYTDCVIAPRAGIVRIVQTCMQSVSMGSVRAQGNRLEITFEGERANPSVWWSVPWGPRRYLIPERCMRLFCMEINDGREPRLTNDGYPMKLNTGHVVTGKPDLPEPWNSLVLDTPLASIIAIDRRSVEATPSSRRTIETRATLPLGTRDGVRKDLGLHLGNNQWTHGFVESADAFSCVVLVDEISERSAKELHAGDYAGSKIPTQPKR